ncbi:hypothetical protein N7492_009918 [Penicillium capsulatum]|uniref:Major facilitator superfamily (MFS) profile domain-containing protein n=1 Tax=Penicillium capsulatum TaxID=69766 RepID=A0A9W9HKK2_9EURO|nr:hypothetical protein N7492_009918 [Penicillium capsulatum]
MSDVKAADEFVEYLPRSEIHQPPAHAPLWESVKKWPRVILYCLALSSAVILYGYDLIVVGTVSAMPAFQLTFGQILNGKPIIPSMWLSLWSAASPIGMMIGAVLGGQFQDKAGRRVALATGSFLSALAVALCYVADLPDDLETRRGVFLAGKLFQGMCIGMVMCVVQTYMSEVLPVVLRGSIIAFLPIFNLFGALLSDLLRVAVAVLGTPLRHVCRVARKPNLASEKRKNEQALKMQMRLDSPKVDSQIAIERLQISIKAEEDQQAAYTYLDCFRGPHLRRTLIVALANTLPLLFGLQLLSNASYFMQVVGMGSTNSLVFLILGIGLGLLGNVASMWVLNIFGRRQLCMITLGASTVLWLSLGIAGCFEGVVTIWYTAVCMMVITTICGLGIWPASYVVAAETSSLQLRAKTQGIGWFINGVMTGAFAIFLPYIFNVDQGNLKAKTGFVMAGFAGIAMILTWLWVPEMKGRSSIEIDRMFAMRLPTRAFKKWKSDVVIDTDTPDTSDSQSV